MFCNKCGAEIKPDDKFCNSCGTPVSPISDEAKYGPKPEGSTNPEPNTDPYSSLDPATNPVNTTPQQNNDFIAPQSGEFNNTAPNGQPNTVGTGYNPQYVPNTVGPQQGNNNTNYNPQYNPNLNTNKKSHTGLIIGIILAVLLIPGIIIAIIVALFFHGVNKAIQEYDSYNDTDYSYSYNYTYSSRSTSSNSTPYSGYGYNSTTYRNTTPSQSSQSTSIPDNLENALYDYTNDIAVQYKLPAGFSKVDNQSTSAKHSFLSGTTYAAASIEEGDVSAYESVGSYSSLGISSEKVTVYGNTYTKVSANSSYLSQLFSNTTYSDYAETYQMEIYNLELNDDCIYQVTVMYDKTSTPPDINQLLNISYGEIDY